MHNWSEDLDCAITVCDKDGEVIYMNKRSMATFNKPGETMVGKSLMPCHSDKSQQKIVEMLTNNTNNCYTIEKGDIKKLIFQTPWRVDGEIKGLVEISIPIPFDMPHYNRNKK